MKLEPKKYYWIRYEIEDRSYSELVRVLKNGTSEGYYSFYAIGCDIPSHITDECLKDFKEVVNPFPNTIEVG